MSKSVLVFIGTRPEAIKMAPVVIALRQSGLNVIIGHSGQHRDMVYPVLDFFNLTSDFTFDTQRRQGSIEDVLALTLPKICNEIEKIKPQMILVHGDTSTTLAGAMAGFYKKIEVVHVEAGLRSHDLANPFPEEMNRKLVAQLTNYHFAPTHDAYKNLIREGIEENSIFVTGNTAIDAVEEGKNLLKKNVSQLKIIEEKFNFLDKNKPWVLLTSHRRENLDGGLEEIFRAAEKIGSTGLAEVICPIHPNPLIAEILKKALGRNHSLKVMPAVSYSEMIWLLSQTTVLLTDSGGLQEEATAFNLPVLVLREKTERTEAVELGWSKMVGTDQSKIILETLNCLKRPKIDVQRLVQRNPFGDGQASKKIAKILNGILNGTPIDVSNNIDTNHNQFDQLSPAQF